MSSRACDDEDLAADLGGFIRKRGLSDLLPRERGRIEVGGLTPIPTFPLKGEGTGRHAVLILPVAGGPYGGFRELMGWPQTRGHVFQGLESE